MGDHTTQTLYDAALQAVATANYTEATTLFIQLLADIPPTTTDATLKNIRLNTLKEYGNLLRQLRDKENALAIFEQYYSESDNDLHRVDAHNSLARQYIDFGSLQKAIDHSQQAIDIARSIKAKEGLGSALANFGYTHLLLGRYEIAHENLQKAATFLEHSGKPYTRYSNYINLGLAYHYSGELDKAIWNYQQGLHIARELDQHRQPSIIVSLNNLGEAYQDLFDMEQALIHHQEALTIIETYQVRRIEADLRRNLGIDLSYLQRYEEGMAQLQQALQIAQSTGDLDVEMSTLFALALTEYRQRNLEESREYSLRLYELSNEQDTLHHQARSLFVLGLYEFMQNEPSVAEEMWQQATFLAHEANERWLLWQIHASMARAASNPNLAQIHNRIAAEIIQQIAHPIQDDTLRQTFLSSFFVKRVLDKIET